MSKKKNLDEKEKEEIVETFTLYERPIQVGKLKDIFRHPDIWEADRKRLRSFLRGTSTYPDAIPVKYNRSHFGRWKTANGYNISSCNMWRRVRASLYGLTEWDIDIKSCHLQIAINKFEDLTDEELPNIMKFINDRDSIIQLISINKESLNTYNKINKDDKTCKDLVKKYISILLYGGSLNTFLKEFDLNKTDIDFSQLKPIENEIFTLRKTIMECKEFAEFKEKVAGDENREFAIFIQDKERKIIDKVFTKLKNTKYEITTYNYDGFQVIRNGDVNELLKMINKIEKNIEFVNKPFAEPLDLSLIKDYDDESYDFKELVMCPVREKYEYFDKHFPKILSLNSFCLKNRINGLTFIPIKSTKMFFGNQYKYWEDYIERNIQNYLTYGLYPNGVNLPENVYNIWEGFAIENQKYENIDISEVDYQRILDHFEIMSGFDKEGNKNEELYEYLLNWFAHKIQKPEKKIGVCLVLMGKQGIGKTILVEKLLRNIMGDEYVYDTADINSIAGDFNSALQGKLVCILNEASGKDTMPLIDRLKDIITREKITIRLMRTDGIPMKDYCDYCFTTNNLNPIKETEDERRFQIVPCSDAKKGNKEYFNKLINDLDNPAVLKSFYYFLKERDITNFDPEKLIRNMEEVEELHELNRDHIELFNEHFFSPDGGVEGEKSTCLYKISQIYKEYIKWCGNCGFKNTVNISYMSRKFREINKDKIIKEIKFCRGSRGIAFKSEFWNPSLIELKIDL